jgi:transposase
LIQATLIKFDQRLPFEKIANQIGCQQGLSMTAASAYDMTRRVCDYLSPEYDVILGQIRMTKVLYIDETDGKVD